MRSKIDWDGIMLGIAKLVEPGIGTRPCLRLSSAGSHSKKPVYRLVRRPFLLFLACVFCLGGSAAFGAKKYPAPPPEFFHANHAGQPVVIGPGDVLTIRFYYNPNLNKTTRVRQDGKISLDLFQGIDVAGETPEVLQQKLMEMYSHEFTKPAITVDVDSQANDSVYVTGEVLLPGAKEIHEDMTVAMVLAMSQVTQKNASTKSVFLIRSDAGDKYKVYKLDASFPEGNGGQIQVMPGDILFVPRKGLVKAGDFMEHIRQLLPATPTTAADVIFTPGNPTVVSTTTATH